MAHNPQILLPDYRVFIAGGYKPQKAEIYNPYTNNFILTNNENDTIGGNLATLLDKNKILLIRNFDTRGNVKLFDIKSNTFYNSKHPESWKCKGICSATPLNNGKVLIVGVNKNKQKLYDSKKDKFINTKSVELNDLYHTATLLKNGNVLITGGIKPKVWTIDSSNKAFLYKD